MNERLRIPELDRLARELSDASGAEPAGSPGPTPSGATLEPGLGQVEDGAPLERLLVEMIRRGATDLLLVPGSPPVYRVHGHLAPAESVGPVDGEDVLHMFAPHMSGRARRLLQEEGAADLSVVLRGPASGRFRVNLHRQRGSLAAAIRALPREIPTLASLHLPATLAEIVKVPRGLVLVCGPTGAGKSSTLAALIGEINRARAGHVVTIEDPVEYEHRNVRCLVEQVEVGSDTPSFACALKAALRQDPDVILVGEMRDLETMATALTAAETGHLILSTVHTSDVVQAIHRIVDVFPPAQQGQVRQQLALSLHAIVCQQLVPMASGEGRLPAVEVLLATYATRNHIRREALQNLYNEITLGKRLGMVSMEESLARLVSDGTVTAEEARLHSSRPQELEGLLRA